MLLIGSEMKASHIGAFGFSSVFLCSFPLCSAASIFPSGDLPFLVLIVAQVFVGCISCMSGTMLCAGSVTVPRRDMERLRLVLWARWRGGLNGCRMGEDLGRRGSGECGAQGGEPGEEGSYGQVQEQGPRVLAASEQAVMGSDVHFRKVTLAAMRRMG